MLTDRDKLNFERDGYLILRSAISQARADAMAGALWEALAAHGLSRDDPGSWRRPPGGGLSALARSGRLGVDGTAVSAVHDLCGQDAVLSLWGQPLVIFPSPGHPWTVPHLAWHTDGDAVAGAWRSPGLLVLWFIGEVRPRGGGTLIVSGSHRLVARAAHDARRDLRSVGIRKMLVSSHPWFRLLVSDEHGPERDRELMETGAVVAGHPVKVVELTGAPGDVVLIDRWILHTVPRNCRDTPRLMARGVVTVSE